MRNLNPDEIYDQVWKSINSRLYYNRPLTNIVFMGMGEPLMNYKNTLAAIDRITSPNGLGHPNELRYQHLESPRLFD